MAAAETASRMSPYVERFLEDTYVREQLRDAAVSLRGAYERASKRRVEPTRDERVRRQLRRAGGVISEAAKALAHERRQPKRRAAKRFLTAVVVGAGGAAAAWAAGEQLQRKLRETDSGAVASGDGAPTTASVEPAPASST
jgi:hypothetical protein